MHGLAARVSWVPEHLRRKRTPSIRYTKLSSSWTQSDSMLLNTVEMVANTLMWTHNAIWIRIGRLWQVSCYIHCRIQTCTGFQISWTSWAWNCDTISELSTEYNAVLTWDRSSMALGRQRRKYIDVKSHPATPEIRSGWFRKFSYLQYLSNLSSRATRDRWAVPNSASLAFNCCEMKMTETL